MYIYMYWKKKALERARFSDPSNCCQGVYKKYHHCIVLFQKVRDPNVSEMPIYNPPGYLDFHHLKYANTN